MKIPIDVDATMIKAAMDVLSKGEPLPLPLPSSLSKLATLGAWAHLVNSPQFAPALTALMRINNRHTQLATMAPTVDSDQLQRNIGMPRPAYTLDDIALAYVTSELRWLVAEVEEYERRLAHACRRYAINGKFDLE